MSVGPVYLKMRQALRKDMTSSRSEGQSRMAWSVADVSRLTGLTIEDIVYTFVDHENHLKHYVLVFDPASRTVHWNH